MSYDKELIAHKLIRWEHYLNNYKLPAWKELPDIGLYMDQVIALLGQYLDFIPMEDSKDKPVTPTTINNYVRLKVMPAPEKRKYYRVHIAFLIMIFTLKQGISINGLQQLLPSTANEEEIKSFYTGYIAQLQEVGNFYTAQTRAAVQGILDPQAADDGAVENVIIQSILQSGFSRIMAEKLLHLQNADPERVMELEKVSDSRGRHPLVTRKRRTEPPCCLIPTPIITPSSSTPTGTKSSRPCPLPTSAWSCAPAVTWKAPASPSPWPSNTPSSTPPPGSTPKTPWACRTTGWSR